MEILDIGDVVEKTGFSVSTLRYYEEIGLITSIGRRGLRRQFSSDVLLQLRLVSMGKSAGFSLATLSRMFSPSGAPTLPRKDLHKRADALDQQIKELTRLSKTLRHVADCPAPSHLECRNFRRILNAVERPVRKTSAPFGQ